MSTRLSHNIARIRKLKGLSQKEIADKLLISQASYCDIESGQTKITKEKLEKIAQALDVTPEIIENLNESVIFNSCSNSGLYNNYQFHSPEEIKNLFNELLNAYKTQIEQLQKIIEAKDALINEMNKGTKK